MTAADVKRFRAALGEVIDGARKFGAVLTPRDVVVLRLGLHASHFEEALAHGDFDRAEAHANGIARQLTILAEGAQP